MVEWVNCPGGSTVKNLPTMQETWVWFLGWEDPLEEGMATRSCILAWRIPWTEEPGKLQSMGWQRIRCNWSDLACLHVWWSENNNFINMLIETQIPVKIYIFLSFFIIWVFVLQALPIQTSVWHMVLHVRDCCCCYYIINLNYISNCWLNSFSFNIFKIFFCIPVSTDLKFLDPSTLVGDLLWYTYTLFFCLCCFSISPYLSFC